MAVDFSFSTNYLLGRGKVTKTDDFLSYYDFGNTPAFNYTLTVTTVEHKTSRERLKQTDAECTVDITAEGNINFDTVHPENIRLFIYGTSIVEETQAAAASTTNSLFVAKHGFWKNVADDETGLGSFTPVRNISAVSVEPDGGGTPFVLNKDYRVDLRSGLIMTLASGTIVDGVILDVIYTVNAETRHRIGAANTSLIETNIAFFGNPACGSIIDVVGFASITPDGQFDYIADDFANLTLKFKFLRSDNYLGLFEHIDYGEVA